MKAANISTEMRRHAPFTFAGTATGIVIMAGFMLGHVSPRVSETLFWTFHPLHVMLSALVTAAMYRLHGGRRFWPTLFVGYVGSVGIATLSDSVIPFVGEWMLGLPNRGLHFGFIEKWWLVNPLALAGIWIGCRWPQTRFPHAGHVLLSTWASLFHMTMALGGIPDMYTVIVIAAFLFLAVWIPCCTSDIIFPLLFAQAEEAVRSAELRTSAESRHHG
jgi:hypothetical protein